MQPLDEFRVQLFMSAGATAERLTEFSCGHVIPPENILPIALAAGPSGKQLDFSYQARTMLTMVSPDVPVKFVLCCGNSWEVICLHQETAVYFLSAERTGKNPNKCV
jgi:chromosome transmission fidelity protein 1